MDKNPWMASTEPQGIQEFLWTIAQVRKNEVLR